MSFDDGSDGNSVDDDTNKDVEEIKQHQTGGTMRLYLYAKGTNQSIKKPTQR